MRKRTMAVLLVCWGLLSAAAWTLFKPAILDWTTLMLAGRADSQQTELIAAASANGLPLLAAAALVLFAVLLARPTRGAQRPTVPPAAVQRASPPAITVPTRAKESRPARVAKRRIYITPASTLVNSGARFGMVLRADANSRNGGTEAGSDREIYFRRLDDRGTLMAQIPCDGQLFKCFVDYRGLKPEAVMKALRASRFRAETPRAGRNFRAWFLLPGYKTRAIANDRVNSFT